MLPPLRTTLPFLHQETGFLPLPPKPDNMSISKTEGEDNRSIKQILRDYSKRRKITAVSDEIRNEGNIVAKKKKPLL